MLIFALPQHRRLLPEDLDSHSEPALGRFRIGRFPDGELWIELEEDVHDRECAVLGSLAPPDEQTLLTLLLADTLRRAHARRTIAVLPYLGYARQDRAPAGRSLGAAWAGSLLAATGVERVLTVDVHSAAAVERFALPVTSLSPAKLFAAHLGDGPRALGDGPRADLTIVAPDEGARERCEAVARAAGVEAPVAYMRKRRSATGVAHTELVGAIRRRAVIVDDILDTGRTLLSACRLLRASGVSEISIMVTHGTLSGSEWCRLGEAGASRILITDTVPQARTRGGSIVETLPIAPLLLEALTADRASRLL